MKKLAKSPFKVDKIERNPHAFALRKNEMEKGIFSLYNQQNILVSGPRGIGKSSFGYQLQEILSGNCTLLNRCEIDTKFPNYICIYTTCNVNENLSQLTYNILYEINEKINLYSESQITKVKKSIGIDLKIFKANIETEEKVKDYSPANISTEFSSQLIRVQKILLKTTKFIGINILIDELHILPEDINFAHFIRTVYEMVRWKGIDNIFFILIGQQGIYERLFKQDNSFDKFVIPIELPIIKSDKLKHILNYASQHAEKPFIIDAKGIDDIVSLSSGYPNIPHIIGNAAFCEMEKEDYMSYPDILKGIEQVLKSNRKSKYLILIKELEEDEQKVIVEISTYSSRNKKNSIPLEIPLDWIIENSKNWFDINYKVDIDSILESLKRKSFIRFNMNKTSCIFSQELLRIFIALARDERKKAIIEKQKEIENIELESLTSKRLIDEITSGKIDFETDLDLEEKREILKKIKKDIYGAEKTTKWEDEDWFNFL